MVWMVWQAGQLIFKGFDHSAGRAASSAGRSKLSAALVCGQMNVVCTAVSFGNPTPPKARGSAPAALVLYEDDQIRSPGIIGGRNAPKENTASRISPETAR